MSGHTDANDQAHSLFGRIIVGIDGSAESLEAARQAAILADGELTLLTAYNVAPAVGGTGVGVPYYQDEDVLRKAATEVVARAREHVAATPAVGRVVFGRPADALVAAIESERYTLLVVGSHGLGRVTGFVVGSTANEVIRRLPCSVLLARGQSANGWPGRIVAGIDGSAGSAAAYEVARHLSRRFGADLLPVVAGGGKTWFFVSVDYAFGHSLERDAGQFIRQAGGTVIGAVRHPINAGDMSSYLVQAQSSKANVVAFANGGADLINSIKQANEFGLVAGGQKIVGFLLYLTDVHTLGLAVTKGLLLSEGFYWDQNDQARAWSQRYFERTKRMPTKQQASVYASIRHYLKAVQAADTLDADAVASQMRQMPVDYFGRAGSVREDGRVVYPLTLYEVKAPAESRQPWDYFKPVREIEAKDAFRPISEGGCSLVK